MGFVANDYALSIWCAKDVDKTMADSDLTMSALFDEDMLGDDLDAWLAESNLMKRTFRMCAVIAGLIERRHPGQIKNGRQLTASSDLIFDVLRKYDPKHVLLEAAWNDAATGLLDIARLSEFLVRTRARINHVRLPRISPLAVPILLEAGRESVSGGLQDELLFEAARELMDEAGFEDCYN